MSDGKINMLNRDRIGALLLLALTVGYGGLSLRIPLLPFQAQAAFTARTVPEALTVLGVVLCLILLFKPGDDAPGGVAGFQWTKAGALCVVMVIYGLSVRPAGFLLSTSLFLIAGFLIMGERRWLLILGASIPVVVFFWVLMTQLLGVFIEPWPQFMKS